VPHAVPPRPAPRPAGAGDLVAISRSLAAAFADDPVWEWLLPANGGGGTGAARMFEWITAGHLGDGTVWTMPDASATAVWAPPGRHRTPSTRVIAALPRIMGALGPRGLRRLASLAALERRHPSEPHWYLAILGTRPDHQGRGLGSAVVAPGMAAADAAGVGCYLESSKESNVPYYQRLGFEVIGTHDAGGSGGPRLWLMWREPVPPGDS